MFAEATQKGIRYNLFMVPTPKKVKFSINIFFLRQMVNPTVHEPEKTTWETETKGNEISAGPCTDDQDEPEMADVN